MSARRISLNISHAQVEESSSRVSSAPKSHKIQKTDHSSLRHLGSHWPRTNLLSGSSLLRSLLVLPCRRTGSNSLLLRCPQVAQIPYQVPHGTSSLRRSSLHPACNTSQLPLLGYRRIHIPEVYQNKVLRMVVKTELPDQLWVGFGTGLKHTVHLLRVHVGQC